MTKRYMTIVFDTEKMQDQEMENFISNPAISYTAWGHLPYARNDLMSALSRIADISKEENVIKIAKNAIYENRIF